MNENTEQSIGDPQPIQPNKGWKIFKRMAKITLVSFGGFTAFAMLVMPTRTSGATRSAKLKWQQHDQEIQRVIAGQDKDAATANQTLPESHE